MSEWISVRDRMPPKDNEYVKYLVTDGKDWDTRSYEKKYCGHEITQNWGFEEDEEIGVRNITHWATVPLLPENNTVKIVLNNDILFNGDIRDLDDTVKIAIQESRL